MYLQRYNDEIITREKLLSIAILEISNTGSLFCPAMY